MASNVNRKYTHKYTKLVDGETTELGCGQVHSRGKCPLKEK